MAGIVFAPMSRRSPVWLLALALVLAPSAYAAQMQLKIELPDAKLMLQPASPPQLLKEGLPLPDEQPLIQPFIKLIGGGDYNGALTFIRKSHGSLLTLLEAGDPEGVIQQRASPGGLAPGPNGLPPARTANRVSAALLYLIGHVYFALEKFRPAEIAFRDSLVALPDYVRVHESLGLLYLRTKRYEEARKHLARAAALGLNTPQLYGALGYLNQQTEDYWGAASAFQQALVMDHDNENWQRGLLNALNETRQYRPEISLVEQMLQKKPNDSDLWLYRAQASISAGEQQLALASLETAIRLGNDSVANKQVCATLHMQEGSVARAIELLKSGAAQGMDFEFLSQALDWLAQKGEWDYLRDLTASLDKRRSSLSGPDRSKLLTQEASLHLHDKQPQAAKKALQSALDLDPSNAEALMAAGKIYRDDHDYNRAELLFQRASAYDLYRENALVALAQVAVDQENYTHAVELLQGVIKSDPTRTDLQRNIESLQALARLQTPN